VCLIDHSFNFHCQTGDEYIHWNIFSYNNICCSGEYSTIFFNNHFLNIFFILKFIFMSELLEKFLGGFPESAHPTDEKRFMAYALECAEQHASIDSDRMRERGVSDETIDRLETAYDWIRLTYDYLVEQGRL
jgi:hypothetical protein